MSHWMSDESYLLQACSKQAEEYEQHIFEKKCIKNQTSNNKNQLKRETVIYSYNKTRLTNNSRLVLVTQQYKSLDFGGKN